MEREAHITAAMEHAVIMRRVGEEYGWVYSQIAGCPLLGPGTYCYLTNYSRDHDRLYAQMQTVLRRLVALGGQPLRSKIEHIVYDSKTGVNELVTT